MLVKKLNSYIELARLDKPIGIYLLLWPSLLGLLLAGLNSNISLKNILIVLLGSMLVRSCGCVINDISDFKIDKLVKRTVGRPLATGALTIFEAWIFFLALALLSLSVLVFTNPLTIKISIFFAALIVLYPLAKRFVSAPQFVLGVTFGSGSIIAYSLQSNDFSISLMILYTGIVAWIISFDTYYALEDKEDDLKININSTAILWGKNAIKYSRILHLFFYACILMIAVLNQFSYIFILYFILLMLIFIYQKRLINNSNFIDAFKINNLVGIIAVLGFLTEIVFLR
tara:strand:+ start:1552 stop:2409 length:858 start_codon:yes stop_codon:yes gene_type:complete